LWHYLRASPEPEYHLTAEVVPKFIASRYAPKGVHSFQRAKTNFGRWVRFHELESLVSDPIPNIVFYCHVLYYRV
jgi:hypothetical protein